MKLPSIHVLWHNFKNVIARFPLQVLLALVAAAVACYLVEPKIPEQHTEVLVKFLAICNLGLTLLLALDVYAERIFLSQKSKWLFRALALLLLTGLFFIVDPYKYLTDVFRIALLAFAFHLLVAFAPFIKRGNLNGFWQYNKYLFLRFLISAFYAAVLYAGLAIALVAIDGLFNVEIKYYNYLRLFFVVGIGFTTIFFLAGVPQNFDALDAEQSYPKGLKIFTQYVLIPLMTIYLAILLVYEAKIALVWELPKGLVSTLILGYAVFGILSLLLIYPVKEKEGNGWIKLFSRFFYFMMLPLVVLLILAIVKRVGHYGITESRYILIVLAAWLSGITIYFLFSKKQNIKVIPISLFILALLTSYGPQSAFSVSEASQLSRLKKLMNGKSKKDKSEIPEIVRYLVDRHGLTSLQKFTTANLEEIENKIYSKAKKSKNKVYNYEIENEKVDTAFALLKVKGLENEYQSQYFSFESDDNNALNISGYEGMIDMDNYQQEKRMYNGEAFKIGREKSANNKKYAKEKVEELTVTIADKEVLVFNMDSLAKSLLTRSDQKGLQQISHRNYEVPSSLLSVTQKSKKYSITFVAKRLSGNYEKENQEFDWLDFTGYLLIKKN